jgi:excisionase family DNA binding protein
MSQDEIDRVLARYSAKYSALLSVKEAAEIAKVPVATIYQWSSQGEFDDCKNRKGKRLRISLDCLVRFLTS